MATPPPRTVLRKELTFPEPKAFLEEYQSNIRHGGTFVPWQPPPPLETPLLLTLKFPKGLNSLELNARVVFCGQDGVGVELTGLTPDKRSRLEDCFRTLKGQDEEARRVAEATQTQGAPENKDRATSPLASQAIPIMAPPPPTASQAIPIMAPPPPTASQAIPIMAPPPPTASQAIPIMPPPSASQAIPLAPPTDSQAIPLTTPPMASQPVPTWSQLSAAQPVATASQPIPMASQPVPSWSQTNPTASQPIPMASQPVPSWSQTNPTASQPIPMASQPVPSWSQPIPTYSQPVAHVAPSPEPHPGTGGVRLVDANALPPIPPSWEGPILENTVLQTLLILARKGASGMLALQGTPWTARLFLQNGSCQRILMQPPKLEWRLGDLLVEATQVSRTERDAALKEAEEKGLPLGQAFLKRRSVSSQTLSQTLAKQLQLGLLHQLKLTEGRFAFYDGIRPPKAPPLPPAHPVKVIFRGKVEEYRMRLSADTERIEGELLNHYVHRVEGTPDDMTELGLNEGEIRFWDLCITGAYMLRDIYTVSNLSRRYTHAVIFALQDLAVLKLDREMDPVQRAKKMRNELKTKTAHLGKETHFDVLEIHWMANSEDVEAAFVKVKKDYDFTAHARKLPPDIVDMSQRILRAAEEARAALATQDQRISYRNTFLEGNQVRFHADLLAQQGDMSIFKGDYKDARHRFIHVLEIEPGNKEIQKKLQELGGAMAGAPSTQTQPEED